MTPTKKLLTTISTTSVVMLHGIITTRKIMTFTIIRIKTKVIIRNFKIIRWQMIMMYKVLMFRLTKITILTEYQLIRTYNATLNSTEITLKNLESLFFMLIHLLILIWKGIMWKNMSISRNLYLNSPIVPY